ncbi:hypothetical protein [Sinomonas atrocyanea]
MAIVLGDGSALTPLVNLVRFGLGGPQIDGPWFATNPAPQCRHLPRVPGPRREAAVQLGPHRRRPRGDRSSSGRVPNSTGPVNVSSPNPTDNVTLMATLRRLLGARIGLPAYRWMLELGSAAIRTETELVLKSRWVVTERLLDAGYEFVLPGARTGPPRHPRRARLAAPVRRPVDQNVTCVTSQSAMPFAEKYPKRSRPA